MKNYIFISLLLCLVLHTQAQTVTLTTNPIAYWTFDDLTVNIGDVSHYTNFDNNAHPYTYIPFIYQPNIDLVEKVQIEQWQGGSGNYFTLEDGNGGLESTEIKNNTNNNGFANFTIEFLLQLNNLNGISEGASGLFELAMLSEGDNNLWFRLLSVEHDAIRIGDNVYKVPKPSGTGYNSISVTGHKHDLAGIDKNSIAYYMDGRMHHYVIRLSSTKMEVIVDGKKLFPQSSSLSTLYNDWWAKINAIKVIDPQFPTSIQLRICHAGYPVSSAQFKLDEVAVYNSILPNGLVLDHAAAVATYLWDHHQNYTYDSTTINTDTMV